MSNLDDSDYYASLTNRDLIQVAAGINREKYPHRFRLIVQEGAKRSIIISEDGKVQDLNYGKDPRGPKGFGGWLLVFSISVISETLALILNLLQSLLNAQATGRLGFVFFAYAFLYSVVICFGPVAVFQLIKLDEKAVRFTKSYLIAFVLLGIVKLFTIIYLSGFSSMEQLKINIIEFLKFDLCGKVGFSTIWYAYFSNSVRVANTYLKDGKENASE